MAQVYQAKIHHKVDSWIEKHPDEYTDLINKERSGALGKLLGILISAGVVLGLIFHRTPVFIVFYVLVTGSFMIYSLYFGAKKRVYKAIRMTILEADDKLKANYDKEVLAGGLAGKIPEAFFKGVLIIFGLLIIVAIISSR